MPWICKKCGQEIVLHKIYHLNKEAKPQVDSWVECIKCEGCELIQDPRTDINK